MSQQQLIAAVRQAETGAGVGRAVVADVAFGLGGDCRGVPDPATCYPVVAGSEPPIRLFGEPRDTCLPGERCLFKRGPLLPSGGPFAVRLRSDGALDWIDLVFTQNDGSVEWPFKMFKDRLGRLQATERDAFELYVVSGWITQESVVMFCPFQPSLADSRFVCSGQSAWLSGSPPRSPVAPDDLQGPIRLQNGAMNIAAPSTSFVMSGTFLIRPVVPPPDPCFQCEGGLTAEVVARLDSP